MTPRTIFFCVISAIVAGLLWWAITAEFQLSAERRDHAKTVAAHEKKLRELTALGAKEQAARSAQQSRDAELAALIDQQLTKEKADALAANERLRAAVYAGDRRLRIAATCAGPDPGRSDLPAPAAAPGLADAATADLSPAAGRAVLNLRADVVTDQAVIAGLQRYVAEVCRSEP